MVLNVRKKRFMGRMVGYAVNPARVRVRSALRREQVHAIGGVQIVLPPDHNLPFYQRRDPTYDAYAIDLLARLAAGPRRVTVIDVGANVGDTAAAVLASDPRTQVISVEGDDRFVGYLRRNLAGHANRARVVDGFVGPVGDRRSFARVGSTGGFHGDQDDAGAEPNWIAPQALLDLASAEDLVVWKSDIDGFDIHILVEHWPQIDERCDVLWFEYDPPRTLGDPADVSVLLNRLAESGRTLWVYENLGRRMTVLPPGDAQRVALEALTQWLAEQYEGHMVVPYLDVWAFSEETVQLMDG